MKTILITGASTGIGRACAEHFQAEGWNVAATMRTPSKGAALAELDNVEVLALDVTDRASIDAAVATTIERFGAIDVVLNNAGYGLAGALEAASPEQLERQFATNVYGPIYVMQACLPHMRERRAGIIANVTSVGGRLVLPFNSLYHGTKFALEGISESLALEVAKWGIQVKLIEPGGVRTDFAGRSLDMTSKEGLDAYDETLGNVVKSFMDPARQHDYSEPADTAKIIFDAVTDGTGRLRYLAGADAEAMVEQRAQVSDEVYRDAMIEQFGMK